MGGKRKKSNSLNYSFNLVSSKPLTELTLSYSLFKTWLRPACSPIAGFAEPSRSSGIVHRAELLTQSLFIHPSSCLNETSPCEGQVKGCSQPLAFGYWLCSHESSTNSCSHINSISFFHSIFLRISWSLWNMFFFFFSQRH